MAEIKITMDKTAIILSSVVGSLGLLSAILGFAGEGANATNPSPGLGICAGIFLLPAPTRPRLRPYVSAVGGCCGCCKSGAVPSETKRIVSIVCSVGSWVAAVIACVLLFVGACDPWAAGLLASGGVLALLATALGIASFVLMRGPEPADKPAAGGEQKQANAIPVRRPTMQTIAAMWPIS
ncbi:hypothetical protein PVAP13_3NG140779 [Panicum virgatum]|uniref:Uncharacterized protein n=1 Tax=Panicum virgatum TaxID=38727 RepID=A0A8T0UB19_PANVG|nr:hypothetical protein PVAP13_3NG140779 [Panicum virgatum]